MLSHQFDDLPGFQPELFTNRFERCPIFPSHLNNPVGLRFVKTFHFSVLVFCYQTCFAAQFNWFAASAAFAAILDFIPSLQPFSSPSHRFAADCACFAREVLFLHFSLAADLIGWHHRPQFGTTDIAMNGSGQESKTGPREKQCCASNIPGRNSRYRFASVSTLNTWYRMKDGFDKLRSLWLVILQMIHGRSGG